MKTGLFRKKPVVIEAVHWVANGENDEAVLMFLDGCTGWRMSDDDHSAIIIPTLEGDITAQRDDWIIKGVKGEFYPCKPDIFEATYEQFGEVAEGKLGETLERLFPEGSQVDG